MTQSVDQTSIKDVTSRQHNDPQGLWIAVIMSSVALHLLVFWLMRYNNAFGLWFPQTSQGIVPIELIEISPSSSKAKPAKPQLKAKTVSPALANQQSSTARSTQESAVTPKNQNSGGINFGAIRKQRKRNIIASKPNTKLVPKKSVSTPKPIFTPKPTPTAIPTPIFTPKPTATRTPTPTPIFTPEATPTPTPKPTSFGNLPWKRLREEISLGKPTPLPKFTPVEPRQPIGEDSPIPSRRTPRQPIGEDSSIPSRRTPPQPIGEDSATPTTRKTPQRSTGGGLIATLRFLTPEEQKIFIPDALHEGPILPEHIGSNQKQIDSLSIKPNLDLLDKEFLVSLVIDKAGNFVEAQVLDPAIAPALRAKYQQLANSIFQGEKFQPARYQNGTPVPDLVNRFVRIKIQRR